MPRSLKETLRFRISIVVLVVLGALMLWYAATRHPHETEPERAPTVPPGEGPPPSRL